MLRSGHERARQTERRSARRGPRSHLHNFRAARVSLPGAAGVSETTDWAMLDVSEPLPDGNYEVVADGKREQVRLVNGQWLSRGF